MKSIIIAAISQNNVIGKDGNIPWHFKEELSFFKETTLGFPVIMGRKTFESLKKPLIKRLNLIITSHPELFIKFEEIKCFFRLEEALFFCKSNNFEKVFIIGGAKVYEKAIELADEMIISRMNFECTGDTFFPEIEPDKWIVTKGDKFADFDIYTYIRKNK